MRLSNIKILQSIHALDVTFFNWLMAMPSQHTQARWLRKISWTGDGYVPIAFGIYLLYTHQYGWAKLVAWGYVLERGIYFLCKYSFRRKRPAHAIEDVESYIKPADRYSFPSGHTSAAFLFASVIAGYWGISWMILPVVIWAALVAFSRMIMGLHFLSDLLFGVLVGYGCYRMAYLLVMS